MVSAKVHLLVRRTTTVSVTACGLTTATRLTREPVEVTCHHCQRTVAMADAEARAEVQRKSRSRKSRNN